MQEQKLQISANNELLEVSAAKKHLEVSYNDMDVWFNSIESELKEKWEAILQYTQEENTKDAKIENLNRENVTLTSVIDHMEQ